MRIIFAFLLLANGAMAQMPSVTIVPFGKDSRIEVHRDRYTFGEDEYGYTIGAHALKWKDKLGADIIANAGMFLPGGNMVGYCLSGGAYQSRRFTRYKSALVKDEKGIHIIRVTDRHAELDKKQFALQLPAVILDGKFAWQGSHKRFACLLVVETPDSMYFYYSRLGRDMKAIVTTLRKKIPDVINASYLEGGPETSLLTDTVQCIGCYEEGFYEGYDCMAFLEIPNVIAVYLEP